MPESEPFALKDMFDPARFRKIAKATAEVHPKFDSKRFLSLALPGLDELNLLQRLRRVTDTLHATLPPDYKKSLPILRKLAPRIDSGFVSLFLPDFVGRYGLDHFDESMEALKFFTTFGSSEFGIRPFLKQDLHRTLRVMEKWSREKDEHVRRLASEGCRPRLPWSFRLDALVADPSPVAPILENLKADPSLYVRKSVGNHLNDITKDHPGWVFTHIAHWDLENKHTAWIVKRALRTLIKSGNRQALTLFGAGHQAQVKIKKFEVTPKQITLGQPITLSLDLASTTKSPQKLVIDYTIHYVKKSGSSSPKVFKWKELTLPEGSPLSLRKTQKIEDYTTRKHHPGLHEVDILINGTVQAKSRFDLSS